MIFLHTRRYTYNNRLHSICWHMEGRQFVGSYGDGALVTWNATPGKAGQGGGGGGGGGQANKPHSVVFPHGKKNKETNKVEPCDPIEKVSEHSDMLIAVRGFLDCASRMDDIA